MKWLLTATAVALSATNVTAQTGNEKNRTKELKEVVIKAWQRRDVAPAADEQNGFLNSGKKTEVITLAGTNAHVAIKTGRQLFSKIPGVFVYDMDGSGNQLNIAARGLDPHRSWEFNIRQNGIIINSDMYGYPASHYSAPMESFEKIEFTRGTGSLQYGAQFGGMMNFVTKKTDTSRVFSFESISTAGSFNLLSTYNAINGVYKKFSYSAYYYKRHADGYRSNSQSDATAQFIQLAYQFNRRYSLKAELGRSKYLYHIPGPLNDSMFNANPQYSTRSRNYFSPDIYIPSLVLNGILSPRTKFSLTLSGVFGNRSSIMIDAFANVPDTVDRLTGQYKNRQVDIDHFNSRTAELRLLHEYKLGKINNKLATGILYMNNNLHRCQLGKGTTGTDYDLTLTEPGFGRDIYFKTGNIAVFAENLFQFSSRWSVSPGLRYETGKSDMSGSIRYYTVNPLPTTIDHSFLLAGISTQFRIDMENTIYGGISQSYRPVIFKDIVPASTYEQIDKNLADAEGYNAEAGIRGKLFQHLQYDISLFRLQYNNRMGTLIMQDGGGQPYTYRTNIGDSRTNGSEIFLQYKFPLWGQLYAGLFTSTAYMDAIYTNGQVSAGAINKSVAGNKIEAVPEWNSRNGLEIIYKGFGCTLLYSYTSSTFSDALNTLDPPASGAKGLTPAYSLWDFNASFRTRSYLTLRAGINNIFNKHYFTKRPTFYPGPGIWPSDGRNVYVTVGVKI